MLASAPVFQVLEQFRPSRLVEVFRCGFHRPVESLQLARQAPQPCSFLGREPAIFSGGQLVEQPTRKVFLQRLPRFDRPVMPGKRSGQRRARWILGMCTFETTECETETGPSKLFGQRSIGLAPWHICPARRVREHIARQGGLRVFIGEQATANLQRLLIQGLGLSVLSLTPKVCRHIVVGSCGGWVVIA